jgi:hypothetical protein
MLYGGRGHNHHSQIQENARACVPAPEAHGHERLRDDRRIAMNDKRGRDGAPARARGFAWPFSDCRRSRLCKRDGRDARTDWL